MGARQGGAVYLTFRRGMLFAALHVIIAMNVRRQNGLMWAGGWVLAILAIVGVGAYGSRRHVGSWLSSAPLGVNIEAPAAAPEPARTPAAKTAPVMNSVLEPHIES